MKLSRIDRLKKEIAEANKKLEEAEKRAREADRKRREVVSIVEDNLAVEKRCLDHKQDAMKKIKESEDLVTRLKIEIVNNDKRHHEEIEQSTRWLKCYREMFDQAQAALAEKEKECDEISHTLISTATALNLKVKECAAYREVAFGRSVGKGILPAFATYEAIDSEAKKILLIQAAWIGSSEPKENKEQKRGK